MIFLTQARYILAHGLRHYYRICVNYFYGLRSHFTLFINICSFASTLMHNIQDTLAIFIFSKA